MSFGSMSFQFSIDEMPYELKSRLYQLACGKIGFIMSFRLQSQNLLTKLSEDFLFVRLIIACCLDWGWNLFCSQPSPYLLSPRCKAPLSSPCLLVVASDCAPLARFPLLLAS